MNVANTPLINEKGEDLAKSVSIHFFHTHEEGPLFSLHIPES